MKHAMTSQDVLDAVVVGAGVVGLAVGRELAAAGLDTLVLERHDAIGEETSSRNSCVIHSGIYYPTGTLKARLCLRGRELLGRYCVDRNVVHARCGKLVVAQSDQLAALEALHARGRANGVFDLRLLDAREVRAMEPAVRCAAALWSTATGIVDVHGLMLALLGDFEASGGTLVLRTSVEEIVPQASGIAIRTRSGHDEQVVMTRKVVNCAGLGAVALARRIPGYPDDLVPTASLAKGSYFSCRSRPFRHLVYPMPNDAGLGIHATLDLDGTVRFGPDVEWVDRIDYAVDPGRRGMFSTSIREYWPDLNDDDLQPAYSGVRPKIVGPGEMAGDFNIVGPRTHGLPGLVNLFGIESPGLTAALAIAEYVHGLLEEE